MVCLRGRPAEEPETANEERQYEGVAALHAYAER